MGRLSPWSLTRTKISSWPSKLSYPCCNVSSNGTYHVQIHKMHKQTTLLCFTRTHHKRSKCMSYNHISCITTQHFWQYRFISVISMYRVIRPLDLWNPFTSSVLWLVFLNHTLTEPAVRWLCVLVSPLGTLPNPTVWHWGKGDEHKGQYDNDFTLNEYNTAVSLPWTRCSTKMKRWTLSVNVVYI